MTTLEARESALNQLIREGHHMDGFDTFYAEDVEMQENLRPPVRGRDINRARELAFFETLAELKIIFHGQAVDENAQLSFGEWTYHATLKDGTTRTWTQVHRRHWREGMIVHERFYYEPANDGYASDAP